MLKANLTGSNSIKADLTAPASLDAGISIPKLIYPDLYTGPTTITPEQYIQQQFLTANKLVTTDLTVDPVPQWEFVKTLYDREFTLADTSYGSWTASTTAGTIKSAVSAGTYGADFSTYEYIVKWSFSFDAEYSNTAVMKAIPVQEYSDQYQVLCKRPNTYANIEAENFNGNTCVTYFTVPFYRYYNTSGSLTYTHSISYGIYPSLQTVTFSHSTADNATCTFKTPAIYARCNATYFATSRKVDITTASPFRLKGTLYRYKIPYEVRKMYETFYERYNNEQE